MGLKDYEVFKNNPFVETEIVVVNKRLVSSGYEVIDKTTGEVLDFGEEHKIGYFKLDKKKFTKVYDEAIYSIRDMKIAGIKVLCYLMTILSRDTDYIVFNNKECMEFCGYTSSKDVYKGLVELIEKDFLAKKTGHNEYFINTNLIFKGDRTKIASRRGNT